MARWQIYAVWVCCVCALVSGIACSADKESSQGANRPDGVLGSFELEGKKVSFYVSYGADSAILGFMVEKGEGTIFFPFFGSTYRGLDHGVLDIFVSDTNEEMWVLSSWDGWETLAYYKVGEDYCKTCYGKVGGIDNPMPQTLGGGGRDFPPMDLADVKKTMTIVLP